MSAISLKSITGITSITTPAGVDNQLTLHTNNTVERLRIASDGKIGINVTDPDSNLEINRGSEGKYLTVGGDDASNGRALSFTSSEGGTGSNGALHTINAKSGNGAIALATAGTERLRITSGGTVGINDSTPNTYFKLDVNGHTNIVGDIALPTTNRIYFGNSDTAFIKGEHGGSAYLAFGANNEKMRLTRAGYLGIGTAVPQNPLDIRSSDNTLAVFRSTDSGANIDIFDDDTQTRIRSVDGRLHLYADFENNVSSSSIQFYTDGNNLKMGIDQDGNVTKPHNAMFKAGMTASDVKTSSGWHKISYNTTSGHFFNIGGHFDTSNYRFTAPVDGYYHFGCNQRFDGGNGNYFRLVFYKNGSADSLYPHGHAIYRDNDGFDYVSLTITSLIYLAANDYVEAWGYSQNDTSWTLHRESQFYGYLVG